jgi:hypothetical protein
LQTSRYANQDDEDLALAMEALGHIKPKSVKAEKEKEKSDDLQKRQQKVQNIVIYFISFFHVNMRLDIDFLTVSLFLFTISGWCEFITAKLG